MKKNSYMIVYVDPFWSRSQMFYNAVLESRFYIYKAIKFLRPRHFKCYRNICQCKEVNKIIEYGNFQL